MQSFHWCHHGGNARAGFIRRLRPSLVRSSVLHLSLYKTSSFLIKVLWWLCNNSVPSLCLRFPLPPLRPPSPGTCSRAKFCTCVLSRPHRCPHVLLHYDTCTVNSHHTYISFLPSFARMCKNIRNRKEISEREQERTRERARASEAEAPTVLVFRTTA